MVREAGPFDAGQEARKREREGEGRRRERFVLSAASEEEGLFLGEEPTQ